MRDIAERALNAAHLAGAHYADCRVGQRRTETVATKNEATDAVSMSEDMGFGVRVMVDGAWGFASSADATLEEAERVARLAVRIAKAGRLAKGERITLSPAPVIQDSYRTPVHKDPFAVPMDERVALLLAAEAAMRQTPGLAVTHGLIEAYRQIKLFMSSEGSRVEQEIIECGAQIEAIAVGESEMQRRSYPQSEGLQAGTAGWEFIEGLRLVENAPRMGEEAVALLSAKQCEQGVRTIILDATQTALQVHESCGHPIELDRVFGMEASYTGTSFLTTEKLNTFMYGSPQVNITADATVPGGLGTFGYDDEGIPAQATPIVREGRFVGYLTSRETAPRIGQTSNGTMRAWNWNHIPLIRMTNINLEPGDWTFDDLIADTEDGLYLAVNKSWSIDDRRLNFQFATEIGWEIKNGKLGQMIKNPTYTGITPQFWGSCDAVCNRDHWTVWGVPNCGKGEPMQVGHVGHGAAPARFRNVRVGVTA